MDSAVIFDVDGVLFDLTTSEEEAFFAPFARRYGLKGLSRDWDSYRTRNDEDIIAEILATNGLPPSDRDGVIADYLEVMAEGLRARHFSPVEIPGARALLQSLYDHHAIGIATANLLAAARLRLVHACLWPWVAGYAFVAEGGGHKRETVARAIAATGLPRSRIVYIGDNLNDVVAGLENGVHFIGFAVDAARRDRLSAAGAEHTSGDHAATRDMIARLLSKD
ncbi:MAG: HAD hydrolase-like protein [Alphaproteobacteria bacterium]|nr:HAD hydrolase-like protein [Alphaproteobacteria bacterium]